MWYLIALASAAFFGWLAHRFSKGSKAAAIGGVLIGLALVLYNPLRKTDQPRARVVSLLHIEIPAGFKHETVIFITDPSVTAEINWSANAEGWIKAPKSGVIRLRDLGRLSGQHTPAVLSDGRRDWGLFNSYINGAPFVVYDFNQKGSEPRVDMFSDDEVVRYFREREAEGQSELEPEAEF
jgi:hypothetical protein